tara:strand:- start:9925 stop:10758 length:834 start_codon:yes stop_codon:yes gene_type:complete
MSSLESLLQSSALQSQFNINEYAKEVAKDQANSALNKLNEEIRKQTGIDNISGIIMGGITTTKGLADSALKVKEGYDKLKKRTSSENPADIKENTDNIRYRGFKETEPKQDIDPLQERFEVPDLDELDLARRKNLLERGEELPSEYKTKMISPETREGMINKSLQEDTFQESLKPKPAFTQQETGKITESLGEDIGEKIGEEAGGIGLAQVIPGVDVALDVGLIGYSIYGGIKDLLEQHKEHQKEQVYDRDMKRVQDIANQTHTIENVSAPTIKQLN